MDNDRHIIVTGGAGYIGSHTNYGLWRDGYQTVVFDSLVHGHRELVRCGEFVLGDLSSLEDIREAFRRYHIGAVLHFAAYAYVGESVSQPAKYYRNNVVNTLNLLRVMAEFGVDKIIFSSTCASYGNPQEIPLPESHPQSPINPYGRSKLMIEHILQDYKVAYGLKYVILRYFNAAGADPAAKLGEWHDPETHLIPLILEAVTDPTKDIKVFGSDYDTRDGTCIRDYVHVCDLARAHILALEYLFDHGKSEQFNLGSEQGFSVMEVIDAVASITGLPLSIRMGERRTGDPPNLVASSKKARMVLGWEPKFSSLENIVKTAWAWHQSRSGSEYQSRSGLNGARPCVPPVPIAHTDRHA